MGKRGKAKSTSLAESRCAKDSTDHNIFCGFGDTGHATKRGALLFFTILKRNKNLGFSHVESENRDTPRFALKNRDILIKSG